jgi:hypothetical protein
MHFGNDGKGQRYVEWDIAHGILKRAWIQHRDGEKDWAGTRRYLNVVRVEAPHAGPKGQAADFPIFSEETDEDKILADFVDSVCRAVGRRPPY